MLISENFIGEMYDFADSPLLFLSDFCNAVNIYFFFVCLQFNPT